MATKITNLDSLLLFWKINIKIVNLTILERVTKNWPADVVRNKWGRIFLLTGNDPLREEKYMNTNITTY